MTFVRIVQMIVGGLLIFSQSHSSSIDVKEFRFSELSRDSKLNGLDPEAAQQQEVEKNFSLYLNDSAELSRLNNERTRMIQKRMHRSRVINLVQKTLRDGTLDEFSAYTEEDLNFVFKTLLQKGSLKNFTKKLISYPECPQSHLLLSVGRRLEAELPRPEFKKMATDIYQRASECAQDSFASQSGYRLGMLQIWDNRCDLAEKVFSKIQDGTISPDLRLRVGYWRWYCADQKKDAVLKEQQKKWVLKEYPLSLHALLVRSEEGEENPHVSDPLDPWVVPRNQLGTEVGKKLNEVTIAAELLLQNGYQEQAGRVLKDQYPLLVKPETKAEVSFLLYWVILLRRANETPYSFQLLGLLFKSHPELISRIVLNHLYPDHLLPLITPLASGIDPFLILSLIRQESAFNKDARSSAGARGLMQLQLPTARDFAKLSSEQLHDPKTNLRVGIQFFKRLLKLYRGQVHFALAAYNAGPGRLAEWRKKYPAADMLLFLDLLPVGETREYVAAVIRNYYWYLSLYEPSSLKKKMGKITQIKLLETSF